MLQKPLKNPTKISIDFWIDFLTILPPFLKPSGHPLGAKIVENGAALFESPPLGGDCALKALKGASLTPQNGRQGPPKDPQMEVQGYQKTPKMIPYGTPRPQRAPQM